MSDRKAIRSTASMVANDEEGVDFEPTQFLTFMLAGEVYAIGILAIREIIEYKSVTEVPMMPATVRGVINLRGAVVPVVDLLARFGRQPGVITKRSCIVIVEVQSADARQTIGVVVDAVNEVLDIAEEDIEPAPSFGTRVRSDFVRGIGKVKEKFVILLDVDQLLSVEEISTLARVGTSATEVVAQTA